MKKWKYTLDLSLFYGNRSMAIKRKAEETSKKLRAFKTRHFNDDSELFSLIDEFDDLGESGIGCERELTRDYDIIMSTLYDWCDYNKVWIEK